MVHAGLAGRVAGHTLPIGLGVVANGSSGADIVADSLVHVEVVRTVEADKVFSAGLAAFRACLALASELSVALVAGGLADISLEEERFKALGADIS